jgi:hypothetical protein
MGLISDVIDSARDAKRFKDTIFYKENSFLQKKYDALKKLYEEYPNNKDLQNELFVTKQGLIGENEIAYQLKKSSIGMYVLRDMRFQYEDLTAQIDFIVVTPIFVYYIECKNLVGNITITDQGDFIREYNLDGQIVKKGMYSPLRQVEAQREVIRKIWETRAQGFQKFFGSKNFNYYRRVLVVAANRDTILKNSFAPEEIKNQVIKSDSLIRHIENDLKNASKDERRESQKEMAETAMSYMKVSIKNDIDYYAFYKNKFIHNSNCLSNDIIKDKLIKFRKARSNEMGIPAYYVFTNDELERLIDIRPKTFEELQNAKILSQIKLVTHGKQIVQVINNN